MSLFNKFEPKELSEILGNTNNKTLLQGFLKQENKPQAYLFYGQRGCGKSLTANLFAKSLGCKDNIYITNASSERGINDIRLIIENSQYKSLDGNNKAFIFEECHQLMTLSQEALLTTLQAPPKDTYFFFTTTEKNKMLPTIQSRCKCLEFDTITSRDLYPHLISISIKENNEISKIVARKIADESAGHVRDAINILESVLQFTEEEKQLQIIKKGWDENNPQVIDLCRILLDKNCNWNNVTTILKELQKENPETIRRIILSYMNKVLLSGNNSRSALIIEALKDYTDIQAVLTMNLYSLYL